MMLQNKVHHTDTFNNSVLGKLMYLSTSAHCVYVIVLCVALSMFFHVWTSFNCLRNLHVIFWISLKDAVTA